MTLRRSLRAAAPSPTDRAGLGRSRARRLQARPDLARCGPLQRRAPAPPSDRRAAVQAGAVAHVARTESMARWPARQDQARNDQPPWQLDLRRARTGGATRSAHQEPRRMGGRACRAAGRTAGAQRGAARREGACASSPRLSSRAGAWPACRHAGDDRRAAEPSSGLRVEDLHDHASKPKLMMPKSGKGGGRNRSERKSERYSVPITVALAKKLKAAAAGARPTRRCWYRQMARHGARTRAGTIASTCASSHRHRRRPRRGDAVRFAAFQHRPDAAAKHSDPADREPAQHSRRQIEKNYSRHITEHSIDDSRAPGFCRSPRRSPTTSSRSCGDRDGKGHPSR